METSEPKKWYKKKGYVISLGIIAIFVIGVLSNSSNQPSVQSQVQGVTTDQIPTTKLVPQVNTQPQAVPVEPQSGLSNNNYYTNTYGNQVHSPAYSNSVPAGASAQCGDGTYSFSQSRRGTCSHHGGVAEWY